MWSFRQRCTVRSDDGSVVHDALFQRIRQALIDKDKDGGHHQGFKDGRNQRYFDRYTLHPQLLSFYLQTIFKNCPISFQASLASGHMVKPI